jgi:hypothetical protein
MCSELYKDKLHFRPVGNNEVMRTGDLVWFGIESPVVTTDNFIPHYKDGKLINWSDFPVKHVAIFTGGHEGDDPLLLHAMSVVDTNTVWTLSHFKTYKRYCRLYGNTRLNIFDT